MRAFVFTDRALERQAGRFVWLSIDAENDENEAFLEKFPIEAYPTMFVIDPVSEQAVLRWVGSATVPQLEKILDDGERSWAGNAREGADAALAAADRLLGGGRQVEAVAAYRDALAKAPPGWTARDRAVESLLTTLDLSGAAAECVETARAELPHERTPHFARVAAAGLSCAISLEGPDRAAAVVEFEAAVRSALGEPRIEMPGDDRSGLYLVLHYVREAAGDESGAKGIADEWLAFLDAEAAAAPTPRARAVYDSHRLSASLAAGKAEHAVEFLRQSEQDLPDDYNPPARLAVALGELGRYDEALAAADRALKLVYGPRKLRVYWSRADILEEKGDKQAARATLDDALRYARTLPQAQISQRRIQRIEDRIAKLGS